jgi:hypothetical protein
MPSDRSRRPCSALRQRMPKSEATAAVTAVIERPMFATLGFPITSRTGPNSGFGPPCFLPGDSHGGTHEPQFGYGLTHRSIKIGDPFRFRSPFRWGREDRSGWEEVEDLSVILSEREVFRSATYLQAASSLALPGSLR